MYIEKSGRTNQQHRHIHSVGHQELPGLAVTEDVADKCSGSLVYFRPMNQNKTAERGLVQYGYILYIYLYILFPFTQWSLVVTVQLVSLRWGFCFFHPGTVSAVRNGTFSTWPTLRAIHAPTVGQSPDMVATDILHMRAADTLK